MWRLGIRAGTQQRHALSPVEVGDAVAAYCVTFGGAQRLAAPNAAPAGYAAAPARDGAHDHRAAGNFDPFARHTAILTKESLLMELYSGV